MTKTKIKKRSVMGRPRKLGASVPLNVRLPSDTWAELKARAEIATRSNGGRVSMGDVARLAIAEWLLAKAVNQPLSMGRGT